MPTRPTSPAGSSGSANRKDTSRSSRENAKQEYQDIEYSEIGIQSSGAVPIGKLAGFKIRLILVTHRLLDHVDEKRSKVSPRETAGVLSYVAEVPSSGRIYHVVAPCN